MLFIFILSRPNYNTGHFSFVWFIARQHQNHQIIKTTSIQIDEHVETRR